MHQLVQWVDSLHVRRNFFWRAVGTYQKKGDQDECNMGRDSSHMLRHHAQHFGSFVMRLAHFKDDGAAKRLTAAVLPEKKKVNPTSLSSSQAIRPR